MGIEIVTDKEFLHQKSEPVTNINIKVIGDLFDSMTDSSLGIAAPQIGVLERIFVARLSSGVYLFANPRFEEKSPDLIPSTEGCLSLPDVKRTILRHHWVTITADTIQLYKDGNCTDYHGMELRLKNRDASIVQHEMDHLDGKLLTDHTEVADPEEVRLQKKTKKQQKIKQQRASRRTKVVPVVKMNPKKKTALDKEIKKQQKKERQRIYELEQDRFYRSSIAFPPIETSENNSDPIEELIVPEGMTEIVAETTCEAEKKADAE